MIASIRLLLGLILLSAGMCWAVARSAWTPVGGLRRPITVRPSMWVIAEPAPRTVISRERSRARGQVVDRLLEGKLTLLQAAAWFRYFDDHPAEFPGDFRRRFAGKGDGEKACRHLLVWVAGRFRSGGMNSQQALQFRRLEDELNALCAKDEAFELPW